MKALLLPLAACAVLAGCASYGDPYGHGYGYGNQGYGYAYPAVSGSVYYSNTPGYGGYGYDNRQYRDRDRDGIPNRMDADRDNDGIPNHMDRRPNNPRR